MNTLAYVILIVCSMSIGISCNSEKTCQCTTELPDGSVVTQEPYTISIGECSDSNSSLEGITINCIELK